MHQRPKQKNHKHKHEFLPTIILANVVVMFSIVINRFITHVCYEAAENDVNSRLLHFDSNLEPFDDVN